MTSCILVDISEEVSKASIVYGIKTDLWLALEER